MCNKISVKKNVHLFFFYLFDDNNNNEDRHATVDFQSSVQRIGKLKKSP
nr:hypothetical protein [Microctonus hyperodae filamentous virus]